MFLLVVVMLVWLCSANIHDNSRLRRICGEKVLANVMDLNLLTKMQI